MRQVLNVVIKKHKGGPNDRYIKQIDKTRKGGRYTTLHTEDILKIN